MTTLLTNLLLLLACTAVLTLTPESKRPKNTIFGDEKLEGQIFESIASQDIFTNVATRDDDNPYRLPKTTKPNRYTILWATDFTNFAIAGTVAIELEATEENVTEIYIHSEDLFINSISLVQGTTNIPVNMIEQPEYNFLIFQLVSGALAYSATTPVVYTLTISFEGNMRTDMYGIYRSWYKHNGATRWMATTQYQATSARKAFPCYDEPSFKAYVDITIRRPTAYRSWSNMRIAETTNSAVLGFQEDRYFTTPYMSTYLLAIIVAEYDSLDVYNQNNQLIYEVIARPEAISNGQGQYALEVGQELLATMSAHTGFDFYAMDPNIKMTQASIPDFSAGAMENWGLLTYREAYLMYDEEHTNGYFKQLIAYILSHEIAHMWFGNLVTCDWWDVLWLNEGFARYYQYFLTHWVEDYMGLETRFIIEQMHTSLLSDSVYAHALSNPGVGSPAEVSAMFSTVTYNKGAGVIRMTEHLLGFEIHRQGLENYLANNAFGVALPITLFQALQEVATSSGAIDAYGPNFSVIDYYASWTDQAGHPVLNVQVNHTTGDMLVTQHRFNLNTGYAAANLNYIVPITFATASNPDFTNTKPSHILSATTAVINRGSTGDEWVIFNIQQTGFYRINYDDYTWDLITLALRGPERTLIHEYNRAQIVNDVFQFARSGLMSYTRAFNILSFLEFETDYAPWVAALTGFSWIRNRLAGTSQLDDVNNLIISWSAAAINSLGYVPAANEDFMRSYLRYQLAPVLCAINVPACRQSALAQWQNLRNNNVNVPVDSRNWVYCNALRDSTEDDFNFLWERFEGHHVYTEKILILQTIGCTPHENSLNVFLDGIVQENELVRPQDYTTALNTAVAGNEANTQIVFRYIQNNLQTVANAFGNIATPLSYVSARLRTEAEILEFENWVIQNQALLGNAYATVLNGASTARESIAWASAVYNDINTFIINGYQEATLTTPQSPAVTEDVTESQPALVEPTPPSLTDSAVTNIVSAIAVFTSLVCHVLL